MQPQVQEIKNLINESSIAPHAKEFLVKYLEEHGATREFGKVVNQIFQLEQELARLDEDTERQLAEAYDQMAKEMTESGKEAVGKLNQTLSDVASKLDKLKTQAIEESEKLDQEKASQLTKEIKNS